MADRPEHKAATLMTKLSTPLPTLDLVAEMVWHWPQPPFARRLASPPLAIGEQPCRIETPAGATVEGLLVGFDANAGLMRVRMRAEGEALSLPFTKVRRLTLLTPWPIAPRMLGAPVERAPHVMHERGYRIELAAAAISRAARWATSSRLAACSSLHRWTTPVSCSACSCLRRCTAR